jgi:hypothetical protein
MPTSSARKAIPFEVSDVLSFVVSMVSSVVSAVDGINAIRYYLVLSIRL